MSFVAPIRTNRHHHKVQWFKSVADFYHYADLWINAGTHCFYCFTANNPPINVEGESLPPHRCLPVSTWWRQQSCHLRRPSGSAFIKQEPRKGWVRSGSKSGRLFLLFSTGQLSDGLHCSWHREPLESSLALIYSSSEAKGQPRYGDITQTPTGGGAGQAGTMEPSYPQKQAVSACEAAPKPLLSNQMDLFFYLHWF